MIPSEFRTFATRILPSPLSNPEPKQHEAMKDDNRGPRDALQFAVATAAGKLVVVVFRHDSRTHEL